MANGFGYQGPTGPESTSPWGGWGQPQTFGAGGMGGWGTGPWNPMPWGQGPWEETPFWQWSNNVPGREQGIRQAWMNTALPWLQMQAQMGQWGGEFDWRKQMDQWSQGFQEAQLEQQKQVDEWTKALQEQQMQETREISNLQTFGRKWAPNTRWM